MASTKHPLDSTRTCPACGQLADLRYDATQVLHDGFGVVRAYLVTCSVCASTSAIDPEPMPEATEDDLLKVIDRRLESARAAADIAWGLASLEYRASLEAEVSA